MFWSKTFIPTLKETPQEAESISHQLLLRSGLIRMLMAGVYSYLPLGWKVLANIQRVIREELDASGACELLLPALQPEELWIKSGRDKDMGEVMIKFVDRKGRKICLGPTHEEVITDLVKNHISSYKQLPLILYQIQTKFRDEIRPRFGLVRNCEFVMKDAYSFDQDERGLDKNYNIMHTAYRKIFKRCGLDFLTIEADPGVMGGSASHEFMVAAGNGEDSVLFCAKCKSAQPSSPPDIETEAGSRIAGKEEVRNCPKCQGKLEKINTLEVGHIFKLGTKYSGALGANFVDAQGKLGPIIMGCYGIGVSRLISAIIEQNHDAQGIIWPNEISPYKVVILPLDITDTKIMKEARALYSKLGEEGIEVLFDDRDERAGVKFKDADLLGITLQVIIGRESLKKNTFELKIRRNHKKLVCKKQVILKERGLDLVDIIYRYEAGDLILRILVDKPEGGISLDECAYLNQELSRILDERDMLEARYILEVFSPGIDRPLEQKQDFLRCLNRKARFFLREALNGKIELEGMILKVEGDSVYIELEGETLEIPFSKINKAKQVI